MANSRLAAWRLHWRISGIAPPTAAPAQQQQPAAAPAQQPPATAPPAQQPPATAPPAAAAQVETVSLFQKKMRVAEQAGLDPSASIPTVADKAVELGIADGTAEMNACAIICAAYTNLFR